ncbi:MAG: CRISPR-associated endoribonuclease Cas6, partial [Firmicutes bacterium]|nr:CRISPR-associated endoribonuclease Cas6 [Bacillota bacterium]
ARNLTRKHMALFGCEGPSPAGFLWRPRGRVQLHVVRYQDIVVKGYSGVFEVQGPPELLQIGLDAGWGAKNAQGFGLTELLAG